MIVLTLSEEPDIGRCLADTAGACVMYCQNLYPHIRSFRRS